MTVNITPTTGETGSQAGFGEWCLSDISEAAEFKRLQDKTREYRQVLRIVLFRVINEVTKAETDGKLQSSGSDPGSIIGELIYPAGPTPFTELGSTGSTYSEFVVVSDRLFPAGPDGSEAVNQVMVFESVTDWFAFTDD